MIATQSPAKANRDSRRCNSIAFAALATGSQQPCRADAGQDALCRLRRRAWPCQPWLVAALVLISAVLAPKGWTADQPVNQSVGVPQGINPGRVVWVHDPDATDWKGPGDGRWYEPSHTSQERVNMMVSRAVRELTGASSDREAWDRLFRHFNKNRGKGDVGYRSGEKIAIKPNWVGMIWREGAVDPETYTLVRRQDYMNTSPQVIMAVIRQLIDVGVNESDIAVCDTLAYLVNEYYNILHAAYPRVLYADYAGKFGRTKVAASNTPFYWSCRPQGKTQDYIPTVFADATYLINIANLKAHTAAGVTLCAKNHMGSLIRWPVQQGYYDMHPACFARDSGIYRPLVDLMGHAHLGRKTVLNLIDGLYSGQHPVDQAPRRWSSSPFNGDWTSSLFASQDQVAIDSVGLDFLRAEWNDPPGRPGVDDYLREAALANNPPSGTFYDPDHPTPAERLSSLGVHEHWNNATDKKYSRNLGTGAGIELIAIGPLK